MKKQILLPLLAAFIVICGFYLLNQNSNQKLKVSNFTDDNDFYTSEIQPIFDKKCIACHSCFNSPCQLNLTSFEGVSRGAHSENIFDFNSVDAKKPTRLYQDANSVEGWRKLGFFSVTQKKPQDLLLHLITAPAGVESGKQKVYDSEYSRVCIKDSSEDSMEEYRELNPAGRMPFGLPKLTQDEIQKIKLWLDTGAKGPNLLSLEESIREDKALDSRLKEWEDFFNRDGLKARLSSRYLYEHLFLASIYFEDEPELFFRLVRSETKTGAIKELATTYPFDKPSKRFFYRLRPITHTIVHKRHIPFPFSSERMEKWNNNFYQANWEKEPIEMPAYGRAASNPFKTFESIPASARYQFFLDNSAYHAMTFIKGPVCRGQTAVNVINDHFWVLFIDPKKDVLVNDKAVYEKVTKNIKFPSSIKDDLAPLVDFRENYWKTVDAKFKSIDSIDSSWLWSSDKDNTNTTLTIYRHFDSAQIIRGLRGRVPKTVWVLDYHVFESIYYNLTAGYNVFGPLLHQVNSRLFMEISRIASEDLFLSFLPQKSRIKLRESWNKAVPNKEESILKEITDLLGSDAKEKLTKKYVYAGNQIKTKNELEKEKFLDHLKDNFYSSKQIVADLEDRSEEIFKLEKMKPSAVTHLPDATIIKIDDKVYTLIHNKDHFNVAMLFFEDDRRNRKNDTADIIKGTATSYINLILTAKKSEIKDLTEKMTAAKTKQDLLAIYEQYGLKRDNAKFWDIFWEISQKSKDPMTRELGVMDLNRYINF